MENVSGQSVEIAVRGKAIKAPSACVEGQTVIARGRWLKVAAVMDEELQDGEGIVSPEEFVKRLKESGFKADIFTFAQKLHETAAKYPYHLEWDNIAAIPITNFSEWLQERVTYDVRKAVRRAKRRGVEVRLAEFNDALVQGIRNIYNESPFRQGKPFWHYHKSLDAIKREQSTYLSRCVFIGAYFEGELVGFIRMIHVRTYAATLQVISQKRHADKKVTTALIAKAVEVCEQKGLSHFVYGRYVYNDPGSSLTEFKRRNGFEQILLPRYYMPLTLRGVVALRLGLHHPLASRIPLRLRKGLRTLQNLWLSRRLQTETEAAAE